MILVRELSLKRNKVFIKGNLGRNSPLTQVNPAQAAINLIVEHVSFCYLITSNRHRRGAFDFS